MVVGSALAVLGIWSMTAPTPAAASSTTGGGGGGGGGTPAPNMYYFTSNGSLYHFGLDQGIIVKTLRSGWAEGDPLEPGQFEYYGSYTVAISSYWDATIDAFPRTIFQDPEDQAWVDYYRTNNLRLPQITRTNYPSAP